MCLQSLDGLQIMNPESDWVLSQASTCCTSQGNQMIVLQREALHRVAQRDTCLIVDTSKASDDNTSGGTSCHPILAKPVSAMNKVHRIAECLKGDWRPVYRPLCCGSSSRLFQSRWTDTVLECGVLLGGNTRGLLIAQGWEDHPFLTPSKGTFFWDAWPLHQFMALAWRTKTTIRPTRRSDTKLWRQVDLPGPGQPSQAVIRPVVIPNSQQNHA